MPNKLVKVRLPEIGRLRLGGAKEANRPGKPLDTFRFTSPLKKTVDLVASIYGGEVKPYKGVDGPEFEVVIERKVLPVLIPPTEGSHSSWMEKWSKGVLDRRCDGETVRLVEDSPDGPIPVEQPCVCAEEWPDNQERRASLYACSPLLRVNVILSELPISGQVLLASSGWNAAAEVGGVVETVEGMMAERLNAGLPIYPVGASLWIASRTTKSRVHGTRHFKTPVLALLGSVAELALPREVAAGAITDADTGEIVEAEQVSQAALT